MLPLEHGVHVAPEVDTWRGGHRSQVMPSKVGCSPAGQAMQWLRFWEGILPSGQAAQFAPDTDAWLGGHRSQAALSLSG